MAPWGFAGPAHGVGENPSFSPPKLLMTPSGTDIAGGTSAASGTDVTRSTGTANGTATTGGTAAAGDKDTAGSPDVRHLCGGQRGPAGSCPPPPSLRGARRCPRRAGAAPLRCSGGPAPPRPPRPAAGAAVGRPEGPPPPPAALRQGRAGRCWASAAAEGRPGPAPRAGGQADAHTDRHTYTPTNAPTGGRRGWRGSSPMALDL